MMNTLLKAAIAWRDADDEQQPPEATRGNRDHDRRRRPEAERHRTTSEPPQPAERNPRPAIEQAESEAEHEELGVPSQ